MVATALELSPVHSVLIEESLIGWKNMKWKSCVIVPITRLRVFN